MINSPLYGLTRKIISIQQAVTLFGTQIIYGMVVNFSIHNIIKANLRPYGITNETFNDICQLQSNLMNKWYSTINIQHAQFLSALALIMESGKMVVSQEVVNESKIRDFLNGFRAADNVIEYENEQFGTTSYYVSGLLFEHWHLEPMYASMLKGLDYEDDSMHKILHYIDSLDVVRTAVNVKDILTQNSIEEAAEIVNDLNLDAKVFTEVANELRVSYYTRAR
jgi:HD-like signal output (HDOD) protein